MAIKRVWHGWTTPENADAYEKLLHDTVFPGIEEKQIPGYRQIELWRHEHANEVEFVTVMTFDSIHNVIDFQGNDYERAYVPAAARNVLKHWDKTSTHYETLETRNYNA